MNWHYFACNSCNTTVRTPIDYPDTTFTCAACGSAFFHEISKAEYDKARMEAPTPK